MFSAPSLLTKKLPIIWAILWEKENIEQKTTKKFKNSQTLIPTVWGWYMTVASFPTSFIFHFTIAMICKKLWIGHGMGRVPMTTASCGHSGLKKNTKVQWYGEFVNSILIGIGDPPVTFHQGVVARSPAEQAVHSTCQTAWPLLSWKEGLASEQLG